MSDQLPHVNRLVTGLIEGVGGQQGSKPVSSEVGDGKFSELLSNLIESVNDLHLQAAQSQNALMAGEPVELHQVMIKAEQAGLSTDLLLEIRNRLIIAYNEIIRMPM